MALSIKGLKKDLSNVEAAISSAMALLDEEAVDWESVSDFLWVAFFESDIAYQAVNWHIICEHSVKTPDR